MPKRKHSFPKALTSPRYYNCLWGVDVSYMWMMLAVFGEPRLFLGMRPYRRFFYHVFHRAALKYCPRTRWELYFKNYIPKFIEN